MKNLPAIKQLLGKATLEQTLLIEEVLRICADECKTIRREKQLLDWENQRLHAAVERFTDQVLRTAREYHSQSFSKDWFERTMDQWIKANPNPQH